jgi:hypothetical protein
MTRLSPGPFWRRTTAALAAGGAAALLVAGCGGGAGAGQGPAGAVSTAGVGHGSGGTTAEASAPPSSAPRASAGTCDPVGGLPACVDFVSVSGADAGGELAWLGTDPLTFSLKRVDGEVYALIRTPCGPGSGPASLDGGTLAVPQLAVAAMGCAEPAAGYGHWAWNLMKEPVSYTYDGTTLTWANARGTVVFRH